MAELEVKRAELEASEAIKTAADKIMDAAVMITNCMRELQPKLKSIANRNYREIQMSANAIRQLVRFFFCPLMWQLIRFDSLLVRFF